MYIFLQRRCLSKILFKPWNFIQKRLCSGSEIIVKRCGPITMIGFNRPEKKNCLTVSLVNNLKEEIIKFENDPSSNAAVIYGERGNFSSGISEEDLKNDPDLFSKIEKIGLLDLYCEKAIVAAVSGFANNYAFEIALWCDFMIVEDTAVLATYRGFNKPISEKQIAWIYSRIGFRKTLDWILTGRIVTPKEAFDCGVVSRVVACGTALGQAVSFASSLSIRPQDSLKANKRLIHSLHKKFCT